MKHYDINLFISLKDCLTKPAFVAV